MDLTTAWSLREVSVVLGRSTIAMISGQTRNLCPPIWSYPLPHIPNTFPAIHAKKRISNPQPTTVHEVSADLEDELPFDNFADEELVDDNNYFEDEYFEEDAELYVGDGEGGGGISLAGTFWDKAALAIAEEVFLSFDGDLKMYAFRTLGNSIIRVRIEKLSNKSGSPSMSEIEAFTSAYRKRLDEAELSGSIPDNISLEVSSPGVERVVGIPQELERFKDRPMYVKYVSDVAATGSSTESDGVFKLVSYDLETNCCTWGIADVKVNREKAGKGRPLSKKQREWRLSTPFDSLRLVRLHCET